MSTAPVNILATNKQRQFIYDRMEIWGLSDIQSDEDKNGPQRLARLLGYVSFSSLMNMCNDRDVEVINALAGPNGYAIYKVLEARCNGTK